MFWFPVRCSLRRLLLVSVASLALAGGVARPAAAESPARPALAIRGGAHDGYDRLAFEGPSDLAYTVTRDGARVTVEFAIPPGDVNLRPLQKTQMTRLRHFAASGKDKLAISFTVDPKATVRDFRSGNAVVFDVRGNAVAADAPATAAAAPEKPAPKPTEPETPPPAAPLPAAPAAAPSPEPPPPAAPSSGKPASEPAAAPAATTPPSPPPATEAPPPPVAAPAPAPPPAPAVARPFSPAAAPFAVPPGYPEIGYAPERVLTLDPGVTTGAAIFVRGGAATLLFDRKLAGDRKTLTGAEAPRVPLEQVDLPRNTAFRFPVPPDLEIRATREGTAWQVYLTRQRLEIPVTAGLVAQPDFALGARTLFPTADAPEPVRFTDPVVGDELLVVPLRSLTAFSLPRRFADFMILPAAQGLVVQPLHEKVVVRAISDGVEIAAQGGLRLSGNNDTGASQQSGKKARAAAAGQSLFDFASWRSKPQETFTAARQRLMQTAVDVPEIERNRARLELARFYFAHGLGAEALALLDFLTQQVPDLATHDDFLALRGASRILAGQTQKGLNDLRDPDLGYQPESELWQAVGAALTHDWKTAEEKFGVTENILTGYPEPFYTRFSVLAVEAALAVNRDREAVEWLDRLETTPHDTRADPALRYLRGVVHSRAGRANVAEGLWRGVARSSDRLYKIRAELALVDLGLATRSLTPKQAAERLEGLRFAWRGDDLELDILHRLGGFHMEARAFRSGFATLAQALKLYPDSPQTPAIRAEMDKAFRDVFLGEAGASLSPLEALALYRDHRDLMPVGEDGNAVSRNLAERLVAIDLLEQASTLLEDQVRNRLQGEEKAKVGARLAAIRLLDRKPESALDALELSQPEGLSAAVKTERALLRARALSEMHQDDEALKLLKDDDSPPAKMLRADITMRAQRWEEAATALLELVGAPPRAGDVLSDDRALWLVNAAIALSMSNNLQALDKLAIDFGAAMAGTSQNDTFRVLVRPDKAGQMKDIAAAQSRIAEVDMFRGFLDTYRGPSTPPAPDAKKDAGKTAKP